MMVSLIQLRKVLSLAIIVAVSSAAAAAVVSATGGFPPGPSVGPNEFSNNTADFLTGSENEMVINKLDLLEKRNIICQDNYASSCPFWRDGGYCTTGQWISWMATNCKKSCNGCTKCAGSGVLVGGQCLTFSEEKISWHDAKAKCNLASLTDPVAVLHYVNTKYGSNGYFWAGGSDIGIEGTWKWNNGVPFPAGFQWQGNNPNNDNNQDCLAVGYYGGFDDGWCTQSQRYICETESKVTCASLGGVLTGIEGFENKCLVFSEEALNWSDAASACDKTGGHLVSLTSITKAEAVKNYAKTNYASEHFWTGGSDIAIEGTWVWQNGDPFYQPFSWRYGEPNNAFAETHGEDCMVVNYKWADAGYYDYACKNTAGHICELDD